MTLTQSWGDPLNSSNSGPVSLREVFGEWLIHQCMR